MGSTLSTRMMIAATTFALLFASSCQTQTKIVDNTRGPQVAETPKTDLNSSPGTEEEVSVVQCLSDMPFRNKVEKAAMIQAWRRVPKYANYRKARPSDFLNADWQESQFDRSYEYGEIAGASGLVMFAVNKTISKPANMSVFILVERSIHRYDLYWIIQNEDLSALTLNRLSGDVFLDGVRGNGTKTHCEIKWDKNLKRWTCSDSWG
jgi:hypothetical protein